ncbi:MAG TPA: hypothetical protein VG898_08260 [Solirubrobacterales bacterium]|nr:hypothetical protein [Solirubrobacterales bacterium]
MPFHVELSAGINHARAFNLEREQLRAGVVAPWLEGAPIELGEREWAPAESELKILEGPRLDDPDLAFGQGWANAERAGEDVTARELSDSSAPGPPDAFAIESDQPLAVVAELLEGRTATRLAWADARERLGRRDPAVAAVILVLKPPAQN